jgi:hypothetical protein
VIARGVALLLAMALGGVLFSLALAEVLEHSATRNTQSAPTMKLTLPVRGQPRSAVL